MTDAATAAGPAPHDLRAARAEQRLQRLDVLADMGVDIAGELRRQVLEGAAPPRSWRSPSIASAAPCA